MMGTSAAWFLSDCDGFDGSVLVLEKDPTYTYSSTARTNSCMRQQFSTEVNIKISQFGADYVRNFRQFMGGDDDIPRVDVDHFGYMYLASDEQFATRLHHNQQIQAAAGAGTRIMSAEQIIEEYPFYNVSDIICGSHNPIDEGFFDSPTIFEWWRRKARHNGVQYMTGEVVAINRNSASNPNRVTSVTLASGQEFTCGTLINATGPAADVTARMVGSRVPVEPRKRYTFVFDAAEQLPRRLPLTIDPSGVHVRSDGRCYMTGCAPDVDPPVAFDDFTVDPNIFEDKIWPVLVHRIPAFERIKVIRSWAGHYAYNTLDHNAIVGAHHELNNFIFMNGFSGHGMQQSPAMGRGVAELIAYGEYRSLDLSPLGYERIALGEPFVETAVI